MLKNISKLFLKCCNLKSVAFIYDAYVLLFHIFLHFIFSEENLVFLAIINLLSIFSYIIIYFFLQKEKFKIVYLMTIFEIVIFAFIANICLGGSLLFYTYNIAVMPIMAIYVYYDRCIENKRENVYLFTISFFTIFSILFFTEFMFLGNNPFYKLSEFGYNSLIFLNSLNIISAIIFGCSLFLFMTISMHRKYEKIIHQNSYLAMHDTLTKLPNRNALLNEIKILEDQKENYCIAIADIDDFKNINDIHGHDCGDYILKEISDILSSYSNESTKIFRFGGEEILFVCLEYTNLEHQFNQIRKEIQNHNFYYNKKSIKTSMTFGISDSLDDFDNMLKNADEKLYKGKRNGKNLVVI